MLMYAYLPRFFFGLASFSVHRSSQVLVCIGLIMCMRFLLVLLYALYDLSEIRVNASMGCQRFDLISYDLIFNVMSRSLLTGSSIKIFDLLGSTCPVT